MNVKERIAAALNVYLRNSGAMPSRITISHEVAQELDAVIVAQNADLGKPIMVEPPLLVQNGHVMWFRGVPVVADLDPSEVLDIR